MTAAEVLKIATKHFADANRACGLADGYMKEYHALVIAGQWGKADAARQASQAAFDSWFDHFAAAYKIIEHAQANGDTIILGNDQRGHR